MKHAKASPSDYKRWSQCPGSITLQAKLIADELIPAYEEGGEAAIEGTRLHNVAEVALQGKGDACDDTRVYVDYCNGLRDRLGGVMHIEAKVPLFYSPGEHGYVDCAIVTDEHVHIVDLKTGQIEVKAENNLQLLIYALGLASDTTKNLSMSIVQNGEVDTWHIGMGKARGIADLIRSAAALAMSEEITLLSPSDDACRFCRCAPYCPEYVKPLLESFDDVTDVLATDGDMTRLSDERMVQIFQLAPDVRKLIANCEKALFQRCSEGQHIDGVHITKGRRGNRTWSKDIDPIDEMVRAGISHDDAVTTKPITPTQAAKLAKLDDALWYQPEGRPKLVSGDAVNVEDDFEVL